MWTHKLYTPAGLVKKNVLGGARALDIGCGQRKLPGAIGMDIVTASQADVIHDINDTPWPFEENFFDVVFASHALEHAEDVLSVLSEIHRVLKPGGRAVIQVPYFRSVDAYADITHRHFFTIQSLDYVIRDTPLAGYRYTPFHFAKKGLWYGWPSLSKNPAINVFKRLIDRYPRMYEQYLSFLTPVRCLTWELEALK